MQSLWSSICFAFDQTKHEPKVRRQHTHTYHILLFIPYFYFSFGHCVMCRHKNNNDNNRKVKAMATFGEDKKTNTIKTCKLIVFLSYIHSAGDERAAFKWTLDH